ncbi:Hypothetical predicted protein [Mytilus galloprovincialis]|uniref:C-type lectin domain-containing protein n=2 Tax=Mytilus galloprovincialis TaxID=29158 RepID=A0A8B6DXJ5_MYTGA|nr:Hypothetical predicted protein [Mytilus galloprovincialis]
MNSENVTGVSCDHGAAENISVWIGLSNINNTWVWDDGTELMSSPWKRAPPLDRCMSARLTMDAILEPKLCGIKLPFFCQYKTGSCYFRIYNQASIVGHNKFSLTRTSLERCKDVCGHVTEFECWSFEYNTVNQFCQLNDVNRWTASESFVYFDKSWDYYHKTCYTSTILSEESDQTTYMVYHSTTMTMPMNTPTDGHEVDLSLLEPRQYVLYNISLSWSEAGKYCKENGGHLANLDGPSNIPETGYQSMVNVNELFWIGLRRTENIGWHWYNNTDLEWSNFKYKPNEFDFIKVCGAVSLSSGWWYNEVCDEKKRFLCQYPKESCEFIRTANASIMAYNEELYDDVSANYCQNKCISAKFCLSYEYNTNSRVCQISQENRWTVEQYYHTNSVNWNYFHRRCSFGYNTVKEITTLMSTTESITTTFIGSTKMSEILTTDDTMTTLDPIAENERMFQELKQEMKTMSDKIKKKQLKKSKTSAEDNRPSAKGVGIVAAVILISIFGSVVLMDVSTIGVQCKEISKREARKIRRYRRRNDSSFYSHNNNNRNHLGIKDISCDPSAKISINTEAASSKSIDISVISDKLDKQDEYGKLVSLHCTKEVNDDKLAVTNKSNERHVCNLELIEVLLDSQTITNETLSSNYVRTDSCSSDGKTQMTVQHKETLSSGDVDVQIETEANVAQSSKSSVMLNIDKPIMKPNAELEMAICESNVLSTQAKIVYEECSKSNEIENGIVDPIEHKNKVITYL